MTMQLVRYEQARNALAECKRVDEVKDIRDKAEAMAAYARQAKDTELVEWATEIKVRAEARCGEMIAQSKQRGELTPHGGDRKSASRSHAKNLNDIGISADQSSRWQQLASMSEEHFEAAIATAKDTAGQVTTAFMLRQAKKMQKRTMADRLAEIRVLVNEGHLPEQIAKAQGVGVEYVRKILRDADIKVAVQRRGRGIDPNKVVRESVSALSGIAHGLSMANDLDIDADEAQALLADLRIAMRAIRSLGVTLKEIING